MADRLRRQKDIITRRTDAYIEATTKDYAKYYEGTPTYVTYYSVDRDASTEDIGLEATNSLTGFDSPIQYKEISEVKIYGIDALDVSNEITERGLQSNVSGEFIMRPDSGIAPVAGDFFSFNYSGMEDHLFKITDVQFDKITPNKYYKCSFSLYPYNIDGIVNNVSGEYTVSYNDDGTSVIESGSAATTEAAEKLVDSMIEKYTSMYYDEDMDSFVYFEPQRGVNYWSPYLQHFLHETKALTPYSSELLTEIYIADINEPDYPKVYKERLYRESIFRNIQIQNPETTFEQSFLALDDANLKLIRNLPFFNSNDKYQIIRPLIKDKTGIDYINAFPAFIEGNEDEFIPDGIKDSSPDPNTIVWHTLKIIPEDSLLLLRAAVFEMSQMKRGALIVLMGNDDIIKNGSLTQQGVEVNKQIDRQFLVDMFTVGTPLHDGAAIINGDMILRAAAFVKSTNTAISGKFGARHQAAKGITEISDAIAILVSEETGDVIVSFKGVMTTVNRSNFIDIILGAYQTIDAENGNTPLVIRNDLFEQPIGIQMFRNVDRYHKVHVLDPLHIARLEPFIKAGDIVYECNRHELEATKMSLAVTAFDDDGSEYTELRDCSLPAIMDNDYYEFDNMDMLYIIKDYLKGKLTVDEALLSKINDAYYPQSIQTYILMPLVIYAIKKSI